MITFLLQYDFGFKSALALGTIIWMGMWWITRPVDIAVTALLPIGINAIFDLVPANQIINQYFSEIVARTICTGGEIVNRGTLIGKAEGIRAHLECNGLMLSEKGYISAIPQLDAYTGNAEMSHEAAVGRIAPEEIEYLMARGLDEDEATATIVRGFLNVNIEGLPDSLAKKITETLDTFSYNKGM